MPWEILESQDFLTSTFKFKETTKSTANSIVRFKDVVIPIENEPHNSETNLELKDKDLIRDGNVIAKDVIKYYAGDDTVVCYSNGDLQIIGKKRIQKFCDLPVNSVYLIRDQIIIAYSETEIGSEAELYCVDIKNEKIYKPIDPASAFGAEIPNEYFFTHLTSSSEMEHILVVANKASTDIGTLCYKGGVWYNLILDDGATIVMPMSDDSDSYPVQMEIEYTLNKVDGATPDSPKIACSKIYVLSDKKELLEFYCVWNGLDENDVLLERLKTEKEADEIRKQYNDHGKLSAEEPKDDIPSAVKSPKPSSKIPTSTFGKSDTPAFGKNDTPAFGTTGFGNTTTTSAFGTATFGQSGFGQTGFGIQKSAEQLQGSKGFGSYSNNNVGFGNTGSFGNVPNPSFGSQDTNTALTGGKPGLFGAAPANTENSIGKDTGKSVFTFGKNAEPTEKDPIGVKSPKPSQNTPDLNSNTKTAPVFTFAPQKKESAVAPETKSAFSFGKPAAPSEADPSGVKSPKQTQNAPLFGNNNNTPLFPAKSTTEGSKPATFTFGTTEAKKEDDPFGLKSPKATKNSPLFGNSTLGSTTTSNQKPLTAPSFFGGETKKEPVFGKDSKVVQPALFGKPAEKTQSQLPVNKTPITQQKGNSAVAPPLATKTVTPSKPKDNSASKPKDGKRSARQILVDQFDKTFLDLEKDFATLNKFQKEVTGEIDVLLESNTPHMMNRDKAISELEAEIAKVSLVTRSLLDKEEFKNQLEILKSKKTECENRLNIVNNNGTQKVELSRKLSPEAELLQQKITMKNEDIQAKLELAELKINVARSEIEQKQVRVQPTLQSIYNTSKQLRRTISTLKSQLLEHQFVINQFIPEVKKDTTPAAPAPPKLNTKKSSYGLDDETREADDTILKPPVSLNIDTKETLLKKEKIREVLVNLLSEKKITVTEATVKEYSNARTHKTIAQYRSEMASYGKESNNTEDEVPEFEEDDDYEEEEDDDGEGEDEEYEQYLSQETTPKRKSESPHKTAQEYFAANEISLKVEKTPEKIPFSFSNPPSTFSFSTPEKKAEVKPVSFGAATSGNIFSNSTNSGWKCDSCLVQNKADAVKCVSCETAKPGSQPPSNSAVKPTGAGFTMPVPPAPTFSFGAPKDGAAEDKPKPSAFVLPGGFTAPSFSFKTPVNDTKQEAKPQAGAFVMPKIPPSTGYTFGAPTNAAVAKAEPVSNSTTPEWKCESCLVKNKGNVVKCVACESSKPTDKPEAVETKVAASISQSTSTKSGWTCDSCLVPNKPDSLKCVACETAKPGAKESNFAQSATVSAAKASGWTCDSCLVPNKSDAVKCVACETCRPGAKVESKTESKTAPGAFVMTGPPPPAFTFAPTKQDSNTDFKPKPGSFVMPGAVVPSFSFGAPKAEVTKDTKPTPGSFSFTLPADTLTKPKDNDKENEKEAGNTKDENETVTKEEKLEEAGNTFENDTGNNEEEDTKAQAVDETTTNGVDESDEDSPQTNNEQSLREESEAVGQTADDEEETNEQENDESFQPEEILNEEPEADEESASNPDQNETLDEQTETEQQPERIIATEETLEDSPNPTEAVLANLDESSVAQDHAPDQDDEDQMEKDDSAQDISQDNTSSEVANSGFDSFGFDTKPKNKVNPMFGNVEPSSKPTSGFGSQPTFSSFGTDKQSVFGNTTTSQPSAFGNVSSGTFGSTGFGNSSNTSAFGNSSSTTFGNTSSSFGNTSQPAFGTKPTSFGDNTQPAFGNSAFTTPTKPTTTAFGTPANQPSAFGNTNSQSSPFGATANQTSTFGNNANQGSGFGASTQPTTFGTPVNSTPAFGQSGFGSTNTASFGQPGFGSTPKPTTPAFGQSGFSSPANGTPGFGQTGFGTPASGNPAFGQSGFGQPAFGSTGFGANKPTGFANVTPASFSGSAFASHTTQPVGFASVPQTNSTGTFGSGGAFGGNTSFGSGGFGNSAFGGEKKSSFTGYRG